MKTIRDIELELFEQIELVKNDPRMVTQAKEIINACGKLIHCQKASMDYAKLEGKLILPVMERGA